MGRFFLWWHDIRPWGVGHEPRCFWGMEGGKGVMRSGGHAQASLLSLPTMGPPARKFSQSATAPPPHPLQAGCCARCGSRIPAASTRSTTAMRTRSTTTTTRPCRHPHPKCSCTAAATATAPSMPRCRSRSCLEGVPPLVRMLDLCCACAPAQAHLCHFRAHRAYEFHLSQGEGA